MTRSIDVCAPPSRTRQRRRRPFRQVRSRLKALPNAQLASCKGAVSHDQRHPLYIPFGCSNGSCPQCAADISNPAFRAHWIAYAQDQLPHGYRGLFIYDVSLELRVGNGQEQPVAPIDPATHRAMTDRAWRNYMARFMEEIRRVPPHAEIAHNAIWFAGSPTRTGDP
jgi:hypothetical protein